MKLLHIILLSKIMLMLALTLFAQAEPQWLWATVIEPLGQKNDKIQSDFSASAIAHDKDGNLYVTGSFYGTTIFGSIKLMGTGNRNGFIAKMDANGNFLWANKIGKEGLGLAVDREGNVYVTASFEYTEHFGTITLSSNRKDNGCVCKLDSDGNFLWAKKAHNIGKGIAVDTNGNCYVSGFFMRPTSDKLFVSKLDPHGNFVWVTENDDYYFYNEVKDIAVDKEGNCYVVGDFFGYVGFGLHGVGSGRYGDSYICKIDKNGNFAWAKQPDHYFGNSCNRAGVDKDGNCYFSGDFWEVWMDLEWSEIGDGVAVEIFNYIDSDGAQGPYICKIDPAGTFLWALQMGGTTEYESIPDIYVNDEGFSYVAGSFSNTTRFGEYILTSSGDGDIYVCKLDTEGEFLWVKKAGGKGKDCGGAITVDAEGNCFVMGIFENSASFDDIKLTVGPEKLGIFIAKLAPPLTAEFSALETEGHGEFTVKFNDNSKQGAHPINHWFWSFGDGATSTEQNPTHIYKSPGVYSVSLTVQDASHQTSTSVRKNFITVKAKR